MSNQREIITLHVGGWGIEVGANFWEGLLTEHGIDSSGRLTGTDLQSERLGVYFKKGEADRYVPRAIFTDLDPFQADVLRCKPIHGLISPEAGIFGQDGCLNNWAKGLHSDGANEISDKVVEAARQEAEACDSLQGFQMTHSIFAGTGGGMGSQILSRLVEEFPDAYKTTFSIMPTYAVDDGCVIRPYNTVLSLHYLTEHTSLTSLFSYRTMDDKIVYELKLDNSWTHYHRIVADTMLGATTTLRFPSEQDTDLTQIVEHLVPQPRLHFITSAMNPVLGSEAHTNIAQATATQLAREMCRDMSWTMTSGRFPGNTGGCLAYSAIFRGSDVTLDSLGQFLHDTRDPTSADFMEWMPPTAHFHSCPVPAAGYKSAAISMGNFRSIVEELEATLNMFDAMFRRKNFLRHYEEHGMGEMDFTEAAENVRDLIAEYRAAVVEHEDSQE
ncbi:tubulin beta chain [Aspergillus lucknowensis]|uniref:Tubulin beta-2 chain n=1 Tax=Aspergillus lucknowensis TaxID=176173 RepID=A0ABR4LT80_9EURO